jgi:peptide/nickel transport system permease protein
MSRYIARRLLLACVTLLGVTLVASAMLHVSGDPVAVMLQSGVSDPQQTEALRRELGLDKPFILQYVDFVAGLLSGDFGESLRFRRPALDIISERLPATLILSVVAMVFAIVVAIPVGILSATRPNGVFATLGRFLTLIGQSIPLFWLGIMLVLIFSVRLQWLPSGGRAQEISIILPALTLGLYPMARITRTLRASLLDVLSREYMLTARSKGLSERAIILSHALRNAALPVVTVIGLQFGALLSGAVVTETIFSWPGIGLLSVQAIQARDLPLIRAIVTICSFLFIAINLLTDLLYSWLDPRLRLR